MNNYQMFRKIQERDNIIKKYSNDTKEDIIDLVIEKDNIIDNLQSKIDNAIEFINKHCVNEKISKEVGYKCYTMADTNELEKIMNILGDDK